MCTKCSRSRVAKRRKRMAKRNIVKDGLEIAKIGAFVAGGAIAGRILTQNVAPLRDNPLIGAVALLGAAAITQGKSKSLSKITTGLAIGMASQAVTGLVGNNLPDFAQGLGIGNQNFSRTSPGVAKYHGGMAVS